MSGGGNLRLRLSAAVDPNFLKDASGKHVNRKTVVNSAVVRYPSKKHKGKTIKLRVLDDISLLRTIGNAPDKTEFDKAKGTMVVKESGMNAIGWDSSYLAKYSASELKTLFNEIIDYCHDELGTLCYVGYTAIHEPTVAENPVHDAFHRWLMQKSPDPSVATVVDKIFSFCDTNMPSFDGISFDIEGLGVYKDPKDDHIVDTMRANITALYRGLADKLTQDRVVAFFSGGFVSDTHINHGVPLRGSISSARIHTYDICNKKNMLVRPMAYDGPKDSNSLLQWHKDIVKYALTKTSADNFQLGIKTTEAALSTVSAVFDRGAKICRPHDIGMCIFPTTTSLWRPANDALNEHSRQAGYFLYMPRQKAIGLLRGMMINPRKDGDWVFGGVEEIEDDPLITNLRKKR